MKWPTGAEGHDELAGMVDVFDFVLSWMGEAAGDAPVHRRLWSREGRSIRCQIYQAEGLSRCTRERGRDWEEKGSMGSPVCIEFERRQLQNLVGSGELSRQAVGISGLGKEICERGDSGKFIGGFNLGRGKTAIGRCRWFPCSSGSLPEVGDDDVALTAGLQQSARRREGGRTNSVRGLNGPWAILAAGPKWRPGVFSSFSFSFSFLFENFGFLNCIDLNNFKSEFFCKIGQRVFELS
jgi:hypothetical protein